jgi:sugar lactone lactonase YvrE
VKALSARSFSHLVCVPCLLCCGLKVAVASAPSVIADGQVALASGFQLPEGVSVSQNGTIYVADTLNNRVVTVSRSGVVTPVTVPGYTLSGPTAVAIDSSGDLFIADSNNARVLEFKTDGTVTPFSGGVLSYPASLAFDPIGNLYIGDAANLAVYKVSTAALQSGGAPVPVTIGNVSGVFPGGLAFDAAGDLYIADGNSNNVYELPAGQTTAQNVTPTGFTLSSPSGIGFDAAGNWFVLDGGNARLIEVPQAQGSSPYMIPVTGLIAPSSLALDPQGNLYVTDLSNNNLTQLIYSANAINLGTVAVGSTGPAVAVNYELNAAEH